MSTKNTNPIHDCGTTRPSWVHSTTPAGSKRFKCPACGVQFIPDPGSRMIGKIPLTPAEKQKRYRARKNAEKKKKENP